MDLGPRMDVEKDAYRAEKTTEAGPGATPVAGFRGGFGRGTAM